MCLRAFGVAVATLALVANSAVADVVGRAISPLGNLNVVFNHDADGDNLPNYDISTADGGGVFDDGDSIPESFAGTTSGFVGGDMFGLGRRPADYADNNNGSGFPFYPISLLDQSLSFFPTDSLGILRSGDDGLVTGIPVAPDTDPFFGVADTIDTANGRTATQSASWTFDITAFTGLTLSLDIAAMGDFEAADTYVFSYAIDGGASQPLLAAHYNDTSAVTGNTTTGFSIVPGTPPEIEAAVSYTLENGQVKLWDDPIDINGTYLDNTFQTFMAGLTGTGSSLVVTFTAVTDGNDEAFIFRNMLLEGTPGTEPTIDADFNNDGIVDAADYTVWRDNDGTTTGAALGTGDSDGDGDVDATDYANWQTQFGSAGGGLGLAGSSVPEPTSLLAAALVAGVVLAARKRLA